RPARSGFLDGASELAESLGVLEHRARSYQNFTKGVHQPQFSLTLGPFGLKLRGRMTPPDPAGAPPSSKGGGDGGGANKKFPDYVPPTKVHYDGAKPTTVHLRKCKLITNVAGRAREHVFDKATIAIGAMEDNDLVVSDDTVSRYHCRIVQE